MNRELEHPIGVWLPALLLLALVMVGAGPAWAAGTTPNSDDQCFRCHGMASLAYLDPATGRMVALHVNRQEMAKSSHAKMKCLDCHGEGFRLYPHDRPTRMETRHCVDCHEGSNNRFQRDKFLRIEREFERSAHFQAMPDRFDCFSCHDPHSFQGDGKLAGVSDLVKRDNAICQKCHAGQGRTGDLTQRRFASLDTIHQWLPKTALHWRAVRCIDCHTPHLGGSHVILPGQHAERNCVVCHSKDSILLTKLYKFQVQEERQKAGFINGLVLNDAYVIGMTPHRWLDRGGLALLGLTLLGVSAHGLGRYIRYRRANNA
ncbi:MAG: cytochrome c3 family protein [Magnetococcales bacterium]|nr:cytochrome c3 family protein [Magnetococcales bacterium]